MVTRPRNSLRRIGVPAEVVDELVAHGRVLASAQARHAELMTDFADARAAVDQDRLDEITAVGGRPQFKAGEFACTEISLAVRSSRYTVQRAVAMTRRLRAEAPDAWDAWRAGDIDADKAVRINRALRRLLRNSSKQLLNTVVVDVAVCRTPEILGRWLNQFIARVEPDLQDERLHRSLADRYVSVRPDLDGVSFLSAAVASVDAVAIDHVLRAVAAAAVPGDLRTVQQRRADALVDLLLGRISNGHDTPWDTNTDTDDHLDDPGGETTGDDEVAPHGPGNRAGHHTADDSTEGYADQVAHQPVDGVNGAGADPVGAHRDRSPADQVVGDVDEENPGTAPPAAGPADDWDLPASAFRPDPRAGADDAADEPDAANGRSGGTRPSAARSGAARSVDCWCGDGPRPVPVSVGVVVSVQSLLGVTDTPGQLADRSASVPADLVRSLAAQPGTLFYRLLTDPRGNLLDVTELGRFPSRKLGAAVTFRDGVCANPACTVPAVRCDLDHLTPVPLGPTTAGNLVAECRHEHRAKTHGGHRVARTGPHTTTWTTPTGHTYSNNDEPLAVEQWPPPCNAGP